MAEEVVEWEPPTWMDGRLANIRAASASERARVIRALESEGMKTPANGAAIARLSARLCELDERLGASALDGEKA